MTIELRPLTHWQTWMRLASAAFSVSFLTVVFGPSVPHGALGPETSQVLQSVVRWGLYASVAFFFIAFACLARRQARADE